MSTAGQLAMFHHTSRDAYKSISSSPVWRFIAGQPPGDHPFGSYFTTLDEKNELLAKRLRIPREKTSHYFAFADAGDLTPLPGGRGAYVYYSKADYHVEVPRQLRSGERQK